MKFWKTGSVWKRPEEARFALPKFLSLLSLQKLNSRLDRAAQEKNDLLSNLSTLEEKILSAENESNVLQEKLTLLMEEKSGIENEMTLLRETLQTAEKEKQVCDSKNFASVTYIYWSLAKYVLVFWRSY